MSGTFQIHPKLLVLASTFPRNRDDSTPPFVFELSRRLTSHFDVMVLAPYSPGAKHYEIIDGVKIHRFKYWFNSACLLADGAILPNLKTHPSLILQIPAFLLSELIHAAKMIRKEKITLIHAHWIIPQGLIAVIYKLLSRRKIDLLVTSHGADIFGLKKISFFKRWILNSSSMVTAVSTEIENSIRQLGTRSDLPVHVIPMGVDLRQFHPCHKNEALRKRYQIAGPFLLFVGRLSEKKGVDFLIRSMPDILTEYPESKLLIVGDGERKTSLQKQAVDLNIDNKIVFCGGIPNSNLREYYATADIFIGPSIIAENGDSEGFGIVFVESMGSGTITVGTDLPAISDIITNMETGVIVRQKSSSAISEAVIDILKHPGKYRRIAQRGTDSVRENFDWNTIANNYANILLRLFN